MIELLIRGDKVRLPLQAEGQLDLPKQPPFDVLTPGWAAVVVVQFGEGDPNVVRLFDAWYLKGWTLDVHAGDGRGTWVRAPMRCIAMTREQGLQITRAWTEPLRRAAGEGVCRLYRPSPRFQRVGRWSWTYELAAERWELAAMPDLFKRRTLVLEAVN